MRYLCIHVPEFPLQAITAAERTRPPAVQHMTAAERTAGEQAAGPRTAGARAVIVESDPVWLVLSANWQARACGVEAGITSVQAQARAPQILLHDRSLEAEQALEATLRAVAARTSPRVEYVAAGLFALDLAGLERLLGSSETISRRVLEELSAVGIHAHAALAAQRATAVLAVYALIRGGVAPLQAEPSQRETPCPCVALCPALPLFRVPAGAEERTLAGLPVDLLAVALPAQPLRATRAASEAALAQRESMFEILRRWGIRNLGELAALPAVGLAERLGSEGLRLQRAATGQENGLLLPGHGAADTIERGMQFDPPLNDREALKQAVGAMLQELCAGLEASDRVIERVRLHCSLSVGEGSDDAAAGGVRERARQATFKHRFLVATREARAVATQLELGIDARGVPGVVHSIHLLCRTAAPRRVQQRLFGHARLQAERTAKAVARVAELFDDVSYAFIGSPRLLDSHRPDAFELVRFAGDVAPNKATTGTPGTKPSGGGMVDASRPKPPQAVAEPTPTPAATPLALRRIRPPLPITISGRSLVIEAPRRMLSIVSSAGPWRSSGEWWDARRWSCDEWDVELSDGSLCRIAHNAQEDRWFVSGIYD